METVLRIRDEAGTRRLGGAIAASVAPGDAVLLSGALGAGKTTLARALIRAATGNPALDVPSPSYTLLQEYDAPAFRLAHLDLWRLDGPEALEELGWTDIRDGVVLVEWPERLGALRPAGALAVGLEVLDAGTASSGDGAAAGGHGEAGERRLARLGGWPAARLASLRTAFDATVSA